MKNRGDTDAAGIGPSINRVGGANKYKRKCETCFIPPLPPRPPPLVPVHPRPPPYFLESLPIVMEGRVIVVVGSLSLDRVANLSAFPGEDGKVRSTNDKLMTHGGGNAGNTAWALRRFIGEPGAMDLISKVGDDDIGRVLLSHFGDDADGVVVGDGVSPSTFIMVAPGSRTCVHTTGDVLPLTAEEVEVFVGRYRAEIDNLSREYHFHFDTRQTEAAR